VIRAGNSGKYLLKPTIKVLGTEVLSNFIEGTVRDEEGAPLEGVSVSAQVSDPLAGDPRGEVVAAASSPTDVNGWFKILVQPGTYNIVAYKDKYSFGFQCDVLAAAGETIELGLTNLETEELGYGFVSGTVTGDGDVTISFRAPGCGGEGNIEVKSITINVDAGGAYEEELLPVGTYEVVASSDGKDTVVEPNIEVVSGEPTVLDLVME
jgi:hypothetical protein